MTFKWNQNKYPKFEDYIDSLTLEELKEWNKEQVELNEKESRSLALIESEIKKQIKEEKEEKRRRKTIWDKNRHPIINKHKRPTTKGVNFFYIKIFVAICINTSRLSPK